MKRAITIIVATLLLAGAVATASLNVSPAPVTAQAAAPNFFSWFFCFFFKIGCAPTATTTTTRPPATTTRPPATTTRPPATTTRPGVTTTTMAGCMPDHQMPGCPPISTTSTTRSTTPTTLPKGPPAGSTVSKVRYGPYTVPAASGPGHDQAGSIENAFAFGVQKPCTNCYVTFMQASLVKTDGTVSNYSNGAMLHHMIIGNTAKSDPICGASLGLLTGQRFFASGNERLPIVMPEDGMGLQVGAMDGWNLVYDLMNHVQSSQTVYIEMTYGHRAGTAPVPVNPVWLDENQCGNSEYSIPAGPTVKTYNWKVNVPGRLVGIGGHLHDGGVNIKATNTTKSSVPFCDSIAAHGETPAYIDAHGAHLSSMTACYGTRANPVNVWSTGDNIKMDAYYNTTAQSGVMGIMIAYVAP